MSYPILSVLQKNIVSGDNSVPVCDNAGDDWDEHFLASIAQKEAETEEAEDEDELYDLEPPPLKIKTYQENCICYRKCADVLRQQRA